MGEDGRQWEGRGPEVIMAPSERTEKKKAAMTSLHRK